jgi:hypothetical protein
MRTHPWPHRDDADSGIVEGGPRRGVTTPTVVPRATGVVALAFPFSLTLTLSFATIIEGEGPPEDSVVPTKVGTVVVTAMECAFLLRERSRMWRPIPRMPNCPT